MRATGRFVYDFDERSEGGRELLGGKGVGLAEMTQLGVPVPAGFTVTTDACRAYMQNGKELPDGLEPEIERHLSALEDKTGKRFGDSSDPLLVSVRSGAAVSMPGMMDTILNLGLNDDSVEGLAATTDNPRFAFDSYRRLIQMYGEVVDGVDAQRFERALTDLKSERGVQQDVELSADDLRELVATFKHIYEEEVGQPFPQDARRQLGRAVKAVFDSWDTPRGQVYRRANRIPEDLGTAVNVVQMVFGNKGATSGTGVAFTRDPSTGEQGLYGEFLADAQGEDVVAARGLNASPGAASGKAILDADTAEERGQAGEDVILVRWETTPDDIHGLLQANGILTAHGGMTSHAAVVARGMGKPCVAGCEGLTIDVDARTFSLNGRELAEGDVITIDGGTGRVIVGPVPLVAPQINEDFETILGWADELRRLKVRANADTPEDAAKAREFGAQGIGLCRTEHMFMAEDRPPRGREMILASGEDERRVALDKLLPHQQSDFEGIVEAMAGP